MSHNNLSQGQCGTTCSGLHKALMKDLAGTHVLMHMLLFMDLVLKSKKA
jgi:hypothetical protein